VTFEWALLTNIGLTVWPYSQYIAFAFELPEYVKYSYSFGDLEFWSNICNFGLAKTRLAVSSYQRKYIKNWQKWYITSTSNLFHGSFHSCLLFVPYSLWQQAIPMVLPTLHSSVGLVYWAAMVSLWRSTPINSNLRRNVYDQDLTFMQEDQMRHFMCFPNLWPLAIKQQIFALVGYSSPHTVSNLHYIDCKQPWIWPD